MGAENLAAIGFQSPELPTRRYDNCTIPAPNNTRRRVQITRLPPL